MQWTNATLRAHLGERGFIQDGDAIADEDKALFYTSFERGDDELVLVEFKEGREPIVMQHGVQVNVDEIGYRNSQIQHKPLLGD